MVDVEFIRRRHAVDRWSIRKLAKNLGHSRRTIRKYLAATDVVPRYHRDGPRPRPAMDGYQEVIAAWLEADQRDPARKQKLSARRIYDLLKQEHGFSGSLRTVERCVRQLRAKTPQAYVPLAFEPGEAAQCDWGRAYVDIAGRRVEVRLFCMRLCASGASFVTLMPRESIEAFLEGHSRAFEFFGGVPKTVWYDNQKTAVTKIGVGSARTENPVFTALRAHYRFGAHFCTPGQDGAHEKGMVENLVGYARRRFLSPVPKAESLEALNGRLRADCLAERDRRIGTRPATVGAIWDQEVPAMLPLPPTPFACCRVAPATVHSFAIVRYDNARYSVPSQLVGRQLLVKAFVDQIVICDREQVVATHPRRYDRGESLQWQHYVDLLERRPGAVINGRIFGSLDEAHRTFRQRCIQGPNLRPREFVRVLKLHQEFGAEVVSAAVAQALQAGVISAQAVRQLCLRSQPANASPAPLDAGKLPTLTARSPNVGQYNHLLKHVG